MLAFRSFLANFDKSTTIDKIWELRKLENEIGEGDYNSIAALLNLFSKEDLALFADCVKSPPQQRSVSSPFHSPSKLAHQNRLSVVEREHQHQYTCITLNRDTFDQLRRRKQKQSKSVFKFCNKSAADKLAQNLPPEPSLETVYCWLALVLQYFKYPKMSPNGFLKPTPLCSARLGGSRCCKDRDKDSCSPQFGKKSCDNNPSIPAVDISHICFNPLHWSLIQTASPSTALVSREKEENSRRRESDIAKEHLRDYQGPVPYPDLDHSVALVNGNNHDHALPFKQWCYYGWTEHNCHTWAQIAFWEMRTRVGALQSVKRNDVIIQHSENHSTTSTHPPPDSIDVISLDKIKNPNCKSSLRHRSTSGIILSHCNYGEVWIYNEDVFPIFISSVTVNFDSEGYLCKVLRVEPGHCALIFNPELFPYYRKMTKHLPLDPFSVKVSFAKGFGPGYSRSQISSCPSWFEILLNIEK